MGGMDGCEMKITIDVDIVNNEGTSSPWWMIIDPQQNMSKGRNACHNIAGMITGPFFSRSDAQAHLDRRRYAFGDGAVVYCNSGYWSEQYNKAMKSGGSR